MTQDPFRGWTSDPASMHRYLYVNQNPTKYVDPLGYQCTVLQAELTVAGSYDSTTKVVNAICDWAVDAWDGVFNAEGSKDAPRDLEESSEEPKPPGYDPETWTKGTPKSRAKSKRSVGKENFFDPEGGEWNYHSDRWHEPHWDYKAPGNPNIPWENVPIK